MWSIAHYYILTDVKRNGMKLQLLSKGFVNYLIF